MDISAYLDEVQSIARTGIHYSPTVFDRERFERLLALTATMYEALSGVPAPELHERFGREIGYVTAKVGIEVALVDDDGRFLLARRADDRRWAMISGYLDPNEHPAEGAVREVAEELGLECRIDELVGVFHRPAGGWGPHSLVSVLYLATVTGGEIALAEHEIVETRRAHLDEIDDWHLDHGERAAAALAHWRSRRERS
ncbi:MAG: NUDIX hydrolase N-terminal domain-containing protein [Actinomycetota bacterium]